MTWVEEIWVPTLMVSGSPVGTGRDQLEHDLSRAIVSRLGLSGAVAVGRGTSAAALPRILRTGIDVEPSTANIYVEIGLQKALEYGGQGDQVLMGIDPAHLDFTWRELSASEPEAVHAETQRAFPTKLRSRDGRKVGYSRLRSDDPRVAQEAERAFSRWIPGDARSALRFLIVISERDRDSLLAVVRDALAAVAG